MAQECLVGFASYPTAAIAQNSVDFRPLGLGFATWARAILGRNWSGIVTVKEAHELVRRGPYAIVRHPIYTGILLAFAGTAVSIGELRGVFAVGLAAAALWRKLTIEEAWMHKEFGAQYTDYQRRVRALIPFLI